MWKTYTYCKIGENHIKANQPCQDAILIKQQNGILFLGLADGAGTKEYAKESAEEILQYMSKYCVDNFDELYNECVSNKEKETIKTIANEIKKHLKEFAKQLNARYKQLGSTLLILCLTEDKFFQIHIGDGIILYKKENEDCKFLSKPHNGETINETPLTTTSNLSEFIEIHYGNLSKEVTTFILASDGGATIPCEYKPNLKINNSAIKGLQRYFELEETQGLLTEFLDENYTSQTGDDFSMIYVSKVLPPEVKTLNTIPLEEIKSMDTLTIEEKVCKLLYNKQNLSIVEASTVNKVLEVINVLKNVEDKEALSNLLQTEIGLFFANAPKFEKDLQIISENSKTFEIISKKIDDIQLKLDKIEAQIIESSQTLELNIQDTLIGLEKSNLYDDNLINEKNNDNPFSEFINTTSNIEPSSIPRIKEVSNNIMTPVDNINGLENEITEDLEDSDKSNEKEIVDDLEDEITEDLEDSEKSNENEIVDDLEDEITEDLEDSEKFNENEIVDNLEDDITQDLEDSEKSNENEIVDDLKNEITEDLEDSEKSNENEIVDNLEDDITQDLEDSKKSNENEIINNLENEPIPILTTFDTDDKFEI
ncbi:MAG: protein phosphatase 2C domain-containing protein [Oscillospiraceae bacterium]